MTTTDTTKTAPTARGREARPQRRVTTAPRVTTTAPRTTTVCQCGCGASVQRKFAQGHDARHASQLRQAFEAGKLTRQQAQARADKISPAFSRKVQRSLELAAERKQAAKNAKATKASKAAPADQPAPESITPAPEDAK
jgi:hypothetical protein